MTQAHAYRLEDIFLLHIRGIARKSYVEVIESDDDFHGGIAEISDLPHLPA